MESLIQQGYGIPGSVIPQSKGGFSKPKAGVFGVELFGAGERIRSGFELFAAELGFCEHGPEPFIIGAEAYGQGCQPSCFFGLS